MRTVLGAIVFLAACSGVARSETRYDLYIFQPSGSETQVYAFSGGGNAAALEVRGCGDVRVLPDASALASQLSARRSAHDISVVTIVARGSRTQLGPCNAGEHDDEEADAEEDAQIDDEDSLVVIEDASARQMRAMIRSLDAAPREVRDDLIVTLGLR